MVWSANWDWAYSKICCRLRKEWALTPQSEGLLAIATGFSLISKDDYDNMSKQFYLYDALYAFCKSNNNKKAVLSSRH